MKIRLLFSFGILISVGSLAFDSPQPDPSEYGPYSWSIASWYEGCAEAHHGIYVTAAKKYLKCYTQTGTHGTFVRLEEASSCAFNRGTAALINRDFQKAYFYLNGLEFLHHYGHALYEEIIKTLLENDKDSGLELFSRYIRFVSVKDDTAPQIEAMETALNRARKIGFIIEPAQNHTFMGAAFDEIWK